MKLRYQVIALVFLAIFASDSWGQSKQPPPSKQTTQPAATDQRGTDQVPLAVKILPAQDAKEQADKTERDRKEKAVVDEKLAFETQRIADYTSRLSWFTVLLFCVAVLQAGLFIWQLFLIRDSLGPAEAAAKAAQDAATAAKTQADTLMAAEGARLYVIVRGSNIAHIFQLALHFDNSPTMHGNPAEPPELRYVLRNYGKTPATLIHVWHGISVGNDRGGRKTLVARDGALEIIGVDGESRESTVRYDETYTFGDSRALATEERVLTFFGEADYQDIFGVNIHLEWEFLADGGTLHQIQHREQRQSPQA